MNLVDPVRQENSPERMDAIIKIAKNKSRTEPEFEPIILELTNNGQREKRWCGAEVFVLEESDQTDGGRTRTVRNIKIEYRFSDFIEHSDYENIMIAIPATKHNLDMLVSHHAENEWIIHNNKIADIVEERAKTIVPVRNAVAEKQQPVFTTPLNETPEQRLARENDDLRKQISELTQANVKAEIAEKPQEENKPTPKKHVPQAPYSDEVKKIVLEKHAAEIEELKKEGTGKYWVKPQYRKWLKDEQANLEAKAVVS